MNNVAKWSMDEYFNGKGISIDGDTRAMLVAQLEGLVEHIGDDLTNEYHDKYVKQTDERIEKLQSALWQAGEDLSEVESLTYQYDFTEGGYIAEDAMMITSKIISHARAASRVAEDAARSV